MTSERGRALRQAVASHGPERGKPYSPGLKARILEYVASRVDEGASVAAVASELGMSAETLRVWRVGRARASSHGMVPVRVVEEAARSGVSVVSASGHRIEGLTLDEAVVVLRALG